MNKITFTEVLRALQAVNDAHSNLKAAVGHLGLSEYWSDICAAHGCGGMLTDELKDVFDQFEPQVVEIIEELATAFGPVLVLRRVLNSYGRSPGDERWASGLALEPVLHK